MAFLLSMPVLFMVLFAMGVISYPEHKRRKDKIAAWKAAQKPNDPPQS